MLSLLSRAHWASVFVLATALACPSAALAQQLKETSKVRVRIAGGLTDDGDVKPSDQERRTVVGTFRTIDADHLVLEVDNSRRSVRVPRTSIISLDVSRERSRSTGALIGAAVGGAVGVVWGLTAKSRCDSRPSRGPFDFKFCDLELLGPMILLPAVGTGVGAIIGKHRWSRVTLENVALGAGPPARAFQIGAVLSF